jgi:hypothetical protein
MRNVGERNAGETGLCILWALQREEPGRLGENHKAAKPDKRVDTQPGPLPPPGTSRTVAGGMNVATHQAAAASENAPAVGGTD